MPEYDDAEVTPAKENQAETATETQQPADYADYLKWKATQKPETPKASTAKDSEPEVPMIVHRERYVDSAGVQGEKEHRVPLKDWAAYEREHKL